MEGPSEAKMSCTDNKDGSCSVEYIPYEPGTYNLNITYGGQPITGTELLKLGKKNWWKKNLFSIISIVLNAFCEVAIRILNPQELVSLH